MGIPIISAADPVIDLAVDIGGGNVQRLQLYEGNNIDNSVTSFMQKFSLPASAKAMLVSSVQQQADAIFQANQAAAKEKQAAAAAAQLEPITFDISITVPLKYIPGTDINIAALNFAIVTVSIRAPPCPLSLTSLVSSLLPKTRPPQKKLLRKKLLRKTLLRKKLPPRPLLASWLPRCPLISLASRSPSNCTKVTWSTMSPQTYARALASMPLIIFNLSLTRSPPWSGNFDSTTSVQQRIGATMQDFNSNVTLFSPA